VIIQKSLAQLADVHRNTGAIATLTVYEAKSTTGKGVVEVDEHGRILRFAEK
jgi:NDP-sugar pyrophosphorylase family protein